MVGRVLVPGLALVVAGLAVGADATHVIRKVGYPNKRIHGRSCCGERHFPKRNLDYFFSILFHGFRLGSCVDIGYNTKEGTTVDAANNSVFQFSRDPTFLDNATCIFDECGAEMSVLVKDGYSYDVAHCVSPAFGPCVPKAWDCLGDATCLNAVECGPQFARTCTAEIADLMSNPAEREKLQCVETCGGETGCIVLKCGKDALDCLDGADKLCHDALTCIPLGLANCSEPAVDCLFQKEGLCHQNLKCLADGAGVCADPAVNMLTNSHVADLVKCANKKCPAQDLEDDGNKIHIDDDISKHSFPYQLACIGEKCQPIQHMLSDSDIDTVTSCVGDASDSCEVDLWGCLGDEGCRTQLHCWVGGLSEAGEDLWAMLTDDAERKFDTELVHCVESCDGGSYVDDAICVATKCGLKVTKCWTDKQCRGALLDLPKTLLKCGPSSLNSSMFMSGLNCVGGIFNRCGKAGLNLVRDKTLADLVTCQVQCTHQPNNASELSMLLV